jgi:hypothetical protein
MRKWVKTTMLNPSKSKKTISIANALHLIAEAKRTRATRLDFRNLSRLGLLLWSESLVGDWLRRKRLILFTI